MAASGVNLGLYGGKGNGPSTLKALGVKKDRMLMGDILERKKVVWSMNRSKASISVLGQDYRHAGSIRG